MDEDGVVASSLLYLGHLADDGCDGTKIRAVTIGGPALDVDLLDLVTLVCLLP